MIYRRISGFRNRVWTISKSGIDKQNNARAEKSKKELVIEWKE
jgi:hypothetical protein